MRHKKRVFPAKAKAEKSENKEPKGKKKFQLLEGVRDILPQEELRWSFLHGCVHRISRDFDYEPIILPVIEKASLFTKIQASTFGLSEELLLLCSDSSKEKIVFRPDILSQIGRAVVEHNMLNAQMPIKLMSYGQCFQVQNPWGGRQRQFWMGGFEMIGEEGAAADAEIILLASIFFEDIQLPFSIQLNSIGCRECQKQYHQLIREFYRSRKKFLCDSCRIHLSKNSYRLFECQQKDCREMRQDIPQTIDHLCEDCRAHFVNVCEYLDEAEISYTLNPNIVRSQDFSTNTLFEVWINESSYPDAPPLMIGGRQTGFIELFDSGNSITSLGAFFCFERVIQAMKDRGIKLPPPAGKDIFLAQLGESAKKKLLKLFSDLRGHGFSVSMSPSKDGLQAQLALASKWNVKYTVILGQKEIIDGTALLRDMNDGSQEVIDYAKIISVLEKRMGSQRVVIAPCEKSRSESPPSPESSQSKLKELDKSRNFSKEELDPLLVEEGDPTQREFSEWGKESHDDPHKDSEIEDQENF